MIIAGAAFAARCFVAICSTYFTFKFIQLHGITYLDISAIIELIGLNTGTPPFIVSSEFIELEELLRNSIQGKDSNLLVYDLLKLKDNSLAKELVSSITFLNSQIDIRTAIDTKELLNSLELALTSPARR